MEITSFMKLQNLKNYFPKLNKRKKGILIRMPFNYKNGLYYLSNTTS